MRHIRKVVCIQNAHWLMLYILNFNEVTASINLHLCVSPYRTCSASTPPEEADTEERTTQTGDPRRSAGA